MKQMDDNTAMVCLAAIFVTGFLVFLHLLWMKHHRFDQLQVEAAKAGLVVKRKE